MTIAEAQQKLEKYVGLPKCQDCGWKLGTDITNYCACTGRQNEGITGARILHEIALEHAIELRDFIRTNSP